MTFTKKDLEEIDYITCPLCEGVGTEMGVLGNLAWYRCQDCGAEFSIKVEGSKQDGTQQTD